MYTIGVILILMICILWIVLSIYKQFRPDSITRNIDPFALIPIWTLFSPRPMKNCCLLAYREQNQDGSISEIIIINDFSPKWYYSLWYGQRRDIKFILGIRKQLVKYRNSKRLFLRSIPYKLISNYVMNYDNKMSNNRQMLYFLQQGHHINKKNRLLFVTTIKKR